jgi:GTP pyrophosphokinase
LQVRVQEPEPRAPISTPFSSPPPLPPERVEPLREVYAFAALCHDGQMRKTGDPYITHPLEVTNLVAELELDASALAAALLHDVQEDCKVPNEVIREKFGADVATLVDGLTKLDKLPMTFGGDVQAIRAGQQAQNLRKMFCDGRGRARRPHCCGPPP